MKYQDNFKFLKAEQMKRKDNGNSFLVLHLLDNENNPCRFFIFNADLMNKIVNSQLQGLQEITIAFTLAYGDKGWTVRVDDISA